MAKKHKSQKVTLIRPPSIKFVKKAGMWVKTTWDEKGQHQEWSNEKPKL